MFESKYSKVLTVILIIVIIAIIGLLGFLAYDYYQKYAITKNTSDYVDNFQDQIGDIDDESQEDQPQVDDNSNGEENNEDDQNDPFGGFEQTPTGNNGGSGGTTTTKKTYEGFGVVGTIEIPATNVKYPVLEKVTKRSIEVAVAFLYGTGINQPGNSVIIGHNYRNNMFFSNNKKLNLGDKIYLTDNDGNRLTYTIYNKFEASDIDTSFYQRDTGGKPEITLSTCTEDASKRLIILAEVE